MAASSASRPEQYAKSSVAILEERTKYYVELAIRETLPAPFFRAGYLSKEDAERLGAVADGARVRLDRDTRRDDPYAAYASSSPGGHGHAL